MVLEISCGNLIDELIALFFIKMNTLNKVRPWDHTEFGVGYPLYSNLMVGGMKPDGSDGTNELSYLALRAMDLNRLPEPYLHAGSDTGSTCKVSGIVHRLIQQAGQDAAVNNPAPSLIGFIGYKLSPAAIAILLKI